MRLLRVSIPVAVLLVAGCTAGSIGATSSSAPTDDPMPSSPADSNPQPASDASVDGAEPAEVVTVIDGDSLEMRTATGVEEVRLLGINTPEQNECWSSEARRATEDLLHTGGITLARRGLDRYGRTLGYVASDHGLVNLRLVEAGHAIAMSTRHELLEEFLAAEGAAYRRQIGLWAPAACGRPADAELRISVVADPPGRDEDPRTGEYAEVVNEGTVGVDLAGWMLRDESSVHRFLFPPGTEAGPGETLRVFSVCGVHPLCFGAGAVWSNDGDGALLLDPAGNVADLFRYLEG